jgi:DNA-binding CsgD family transcriptional regulator
LGIHAGAIGSTIEAFQSAALGAGQWLTAIESLATLTGARYGQLIGLGSDAAVPFNWMSGGPPEITDEFLAANGGDIRINSRVRIGGRAAPLTVLDERAFTTDADCQRNPEYGEWVRRHDVSFICLSPLVHQDETLIGLAVIRTARQGLIDDQARQAYATVAPHARAAVRMQMAIESRGLQLFGGLLEAMPGAAFICDAAGRLRTMSTRAEALAAEDGLLRLRHGRLTPRADIDPRPRRTALARAAEIGDGGIGAPPQDVVLRDPATGDHVRLEITTIPSESRQFGVSVLVVAHVADDRQLRTAELCRLLYGLTPMEGSVAARLVSGQGPQAVADEMGVTVGTVRTHIRSIYEKAGVRSQLELSAVIRRI